MDDFEKAVLVSFDQSGTVDAGVKVCVDLWEGDPSGRVCVEA